MTAAGGDTAVPVPVLYEGRLYEMARGRLFLVVDPARRVYGMDALAARYATALSVIDPMAPSACRPGRVLLGAPHVRFLCRMLDRRESEPVRCALAGPVSDVLRAMRDHDLGRLFVDAPGRLGCQASSDGCLEQDPARLSQEIERQERVSLRWRASMMVASRPATTP